MEPYATRPDTAFYLGDVLAVLRSLPSGSVHAVVTSPPYFGLRSYLPSEHPDKAKEIGSERIHDCLAWARGESPCLECYVCTMRRVFAEIARVLRSDGTCWANWGDSYNAGTSKQRKPSENAKHGYWQNDQIVERIDVPALAPKNLLLMPYRCALALQSDDWYIRSDITWHKPACMPESVTDRPTCAHETIWLMARSERYFYDSEAVKEASVSDHGSGNGYKRDYQLSRNGRGNDEHYQPTSNRNLRNVWTISPEPNSRKHYASFPTEIARKAILAGTSEKGVCSECGKAWVRVTERSYKLDTTRPQSRRALEIAENAGLNDEHFAAIRAVGLTDTMRGQTLQTGFWKNTSEVMRLADEARAVLRGYYREFLLTGKETAGWRPSCDHDAPVVPAVVLDPFGGSGTVSVVARELGRHSV